MQEAEVAEELELLADLIVDVAVGGVKAGEFAGVGVEVGEGEVGFVEGAEEVEDVEGPAASPDLEFFEGVQTAGGAAG